MMNGIMQEIRDLLESGLPSREVLSLGYAPSTVYKVQRRMRLASIGASSRPDAPGAESGVTDSAQGIRELEEEVGSLEETLNSLSAEVTELETACAELENTKATIENLKDSRSITTGARL